MGLSSTTVTQSACKAIEFGEKTQERAIAPFKVIQGHRKSVCDFLLVINSDWHLISYRFGVIAGYCSNLGHFAFGKRVVDFLLVLIELFSLGVTAEALRAKIDRKSVISL